jgi:molecular chaperone Hsp33
VLIDQGEGMVPYQGITPIAGGSLSDCAQTYFAQSEQLPTRFALSFGRSTVPGEGARWRGGRRDAAAHAQGLALRCRRGGFGRRRAAQPYRHPLGGDAKTGRAPTCCSTPSRSWS